MNKISGEKELVGVKQELEYKQNEVESINHLCALLDKDRKRGIVGGNKDRGKNNARDKERERQKDKENEGGKNS